MSLKANVLRTYSHHIPILRWMTLRCLININQHHDEANGDLRHDRLRKSTRLARYWVPLRIPRALLAMFNIFNICVMKRGKCISVGIRLALELSANASNTAYTLRTIKRTKKLRNTYTKKHFISYLFLHFLAI